MTKIQMPDPVAYAIFEENGNIRIWAKEPRDLPDLDSLGPMRQLITTDQAEAYVDARVREALEEAAQVADDWAMQYVEVDNSPERAGEYIRNLIPKEEQK